MRSSLRFLAPAVALGCVLLLTSCGAIFPATIPISNNTTYSMSVSPQPTSIPAGSTVTFTATTNAPANQVDWFLGSFAYANVGSPNTALGTTTFTYTAPATPPVYSSPFTPTPGIVTINTSAGATGVATTFAITAPSVTTGISAYGPNGTSVALGATVIINAYAVGSTNNALTMQVNGVTGGSTSYGTIALTPNGFYGDYTYTAPATMPMTGSTVTITVISQADPSKSSSLTLTLH